MAFYSSSEQFYACAQALFDRLEKENPSAGDDVIAAKLLIRLLCSDPMAAILINGRRRPVSVSYGVNRIRPELEVTLKTDTLHQILLGKLSLSKALSAKALRVRGPVWKTLALGELFDQCQALYPQILREQGLLP